MNPSRPRARRQLRKVFAILLCVTIAVAGLGQAVLHLWNWLMPSIFGLRPVTFGQALGLLALSWILFGGLRGFRPGPRRWRSRHAACCGRRAHERYTDFTAERGPSGAARQF